MGSWSASNEYSTVMEARRRYHTAKMTRKEAKTSYFEPLQGHSAAAWGMESGTISGAGHSRDTGGGCSRDTLRVSFDGFSGGGHSRDTLRGVFGRSALQEYAGDSLGGLS